MTVPVEATTESAAAEGRCPNCGKPRADLSQPCPHCGAAPLGPADPGAPPALGTTGRRTLADAIMHVRSTDLEPYIGLRYLSKLFRLIAILLVLLMLAEVITGFMTQGAAALPTLLAEASRMIVLAAALWGIGDMASLLIDIGHDVRAARILLGRQTAHSLTDHHHEVRRAGGAQPSASPGTSSHEPGEPR